MSNLDRMRKDLDTLIERGNMLLQRMLFEVHPDEFQKAQGKSRSEIEKILPAFTQNYQQWYSEALAMLGVLLPNRVDDFRHYYQLPRPPKELDISTYTISDYLKGIRATQYGKDVAVPRMAITPMEQQLQIVESARGRFESSLFDIKAMAQADLFDNELDAAIELNKMGFARGAGAIAGVVLEGHLATVCQTHSVTISRKKPTLSDFYEALKSENIIDQATWRFIQHLGDVRNKCDHKGNDPTRDEVDDLIAGTRKISKTVF